MNNVVGQPDWCLVVMLRVVLEFHQFNLLMSQNSIEHLHDNIIDGGICILPPKAREV